MADLSVLKKEILADGRIDADEVARIRSAIFADGRIDRAEADFLFELNDACSSASNDGGWEALFVEAISAHLLNDASSPGVVDDDESEWLLSKLQADGTIDRVEKSLLSALAKSATSLPDKLRDFSKQNG